MFCNKFQFGVYGLQNENRKILILVINPNPYTIKILGKMRARGGYGI